MIDDLLSRIEEYQERLREYWARRAAEENDEEEDEYEDEFVGDESIGEEDGEEYTPPVIPDEIRFDETAEEINGHRRWKPESNGVKPLRYAVSPDNPWYFEIDGVVFSRETGLLVLFPPGKGEVYAIPDDDRITGIGYRAFCANHQLKEIIWNDRVRYIADGSFEGCASLREAVIPETVEFIGKDAFGGCVSLTKAMIHSRITGLERRLFYRDTALESVRYPADITGLGRGVFAGCASLRDIRPLGDEQRDFDAVIAPGITEIGRDAFSGCAAIRYVSVPDSVTTIGQGAFAGCVSLKGISTESVRVYHANCFQNCTGLEEFTFSSQTRHLGREILAGADHLKSVRFSCAPGFTSDPSALPEEMEYTVDTGAYLAAVVPYSCKPLFWACIHNLTEGEQVEEDLLDNALRILKRNRKNLLDRFLESEKLLAFVLEYDIPDCDNCVVMLKAAEAEKPGMADMIRAYTRRRFTGRKMANAVDRWEEKEREKQETERKEKQLREELKRQKEQRLAEIRENLQKQKADILESLPDGTDMLIEDMKLSVRAYNCLKRHGINTLSELALMCREDYRKVRNLGVKAADEVIGKVELMTGRVVPDERDEG